MKTKEKVKVIAQTVGMVAVVAIFIVGIPYVMTHLYELGIKKPKFVPGACVQRDISSEFEKRISYRVVLKVGKTQYLVGTYKFEEDGSAYMYKYLDAENIKWFDDDWTQIDCPGNRQNF